MNKADQAYLDDKWNTVMNNIHALLIWQFIGLLQASLGYMQRIMWMMDDCQGGMNEG